VNVPEGKSIVLGDNVLNNSLHFRGRYPWLDKKCAQLKMGKEDFSCPEDDENVGENETETI